MGHLLLKGGALSRTGHCRRSHGPVARSAGRGGLRTGQTAEELARLGQRIAPDDLADLRAAGAGLGRQARQRRQHALERGMVDEPPGRRGALHGCNARLQLREIGGIAFILADPLQQNRGPAESRRLVAWIDERPHHVDKIN